MKVLFDTSILLISLPRRSKYRPIFDAYFENKISLVITTPIFLEYLEMLHEKSGIKAADYVQESLNSAENVILVQVYFSWRLIVSDPDDDKFTDAYIASNADYLVTNDAHFKVVKEKEFPLINIVSAAEFLEILKDLK